ncbi:hypothetical protein Glove_46g87 [Diversispora epigaea]|uniref:Uncharacterized protein n=1 Tax=Diversispora epigaea TaxID=1348612 RepID=A0A397JEN5_9GLOM|nr:hypothetical protein Glove_46g87 [Diversispora epigaea]
MVEEVFGTLSTEKCVYVIIHNPVIIMNELEEKSKDDFSFDKQFEHYIIPRFVLYITETTVNEEYKKVTSVLLKDGELKALDRTFYETPHIKPNPGTVPNRSTNPLILQPTQAPQQLTLPRPNRFSTPTPWFLPNSQHNETLNWNKIMTNVSHDTKYLNLLTDQVINPTIYIIRARVPQNPDSPYTDPTF